MKLGMCGGVMKKSKKYHHVQSGKLKPFMFPIQWIDVSACIHIHQIVFDSLQLLS